MNPTAAKALFEAAIAGFDDRHLAARGWIVHSRAFPSLDLSFRSAERQELRIRVGCEDWNDTPPSVDLLSPNGTLTGIPAQRSGSTSSIFNASSHPRTGRPFVCMVGIREYHDHPSHVRDLWTNYKSLDSYSLGGILMQLWRGWERFWP